MDNAFDCFSLFFQCRAIVWTSNVIEKYNWKNAFTLFKFWYLVHNFILFFSFINKQNAFLGFQFIAKDFPFVDIIAVKELLVIFGLLNSESISFQRDLNNMAHNMIKSMDLKNRLLIGQVLCWDTLTYICFNVVDCVYRMIFPDLLF